MDPDGFLRSGRWNPKQATLVIPTPSAPPRDRATEQPRATTTSRSGINPPYSHGSDPVGRGEGMGWSTPAPLSPRQCSCQPVEQLRIEAFEPQ